MDKNAIIKLFLRFLKNKGVYHYYKLGFTSFNKEIIMINFFTKTNFRNFIMDSFSWSSMNYKFNTKIKWFLLDSQWRKICENL